MNETIRSFIAMELEPHVRNELRALQATLKSSGADVKWVKPENIHLTLKFLGEISAEQISSIKEALPAMVKDLLPFDIKISSLGAFPRINRPKIIWAGISLGEETISKIAQNIEEGLSYLGFEKENRTFSSHITIGRVRSFKNLTSLTAAINNTTLPPLNQPIKHITLFKSTLTPQGPIYEPLQNISLGTS